MNRKNRPPLLSALCILTFIGSTIGFIGYFLTAILFEKTAELVIKYSSWHSVDDISPIYFTILMALFAISLTGAIRIWKFHKDGFFLYTFSQMLILFLPVFWIGWQAFSTTNMIFTIVFILGYTLNYRQLKQA